MPGDVAQAKANSEDRFHVGLCQKSTDQPVIGVINNLRSSFLLAVHQHHKQFNEKSVINIKEEVS